MAEIRDVVVALIILRRKVRERKFLPCLKFHLSLSKAAVANSVLQRDKTGKMPYITNRD